MGRFTPDTIDRVRDAVDMVELVGGKTDLRRVGTRWTGLCPFHDERTPSFSVDPAKKLYHCFGCGEGGDAISFVRQTEALDFPEALELLAERYNVRVERVEDDPRVEARRRRNERLYSVLDRTARFYATYLWESAEAARARDYLTERGFSREVLEQFRVGYSPSAWDRVSLAARRDGFGQEELLAAGLAQTGRGGGVYDRFRGRIMFPLADSRSRVLGFGARAMGETRGPKYLNTSENDVYHKGSQLFGIDHAKPHAAKSGRVVVVEGYTDVLALHQAGLPESVAIMGTSLTQEQLALLSQSARLVLLALDSDRAGQVAMLRAARAADDRDVELRVVALPEGQDPADLLAGEGADGFAKRLDRAVSVLEFQVARVLADADLDTAAGRDRAFEETRPLIAATPERSAMRDELVRQVADRLDVPVTYVTTQMAGPPREPAGDALTTVGKASLDAEREFLAMCLAGGERGSDYFGQLRKEHFSSEEDKRLFEHLASRIEDPLTGLSDDDPSLASAVHRVVDASLDHEGVTDANLRMSFLGLETRRVEREIRRAREQGDYSKNDELARAKQRVRREMDAVMGQTV
jgi:DNA primase